MPRKNYDLTAVLITDWGGSRSTGTGNFLSGLSDDGYLGWITAMTTVNYRGQWSPETIYKVAKKLLEEKNL